MLTYVSQALAASLSVLLLWATLGHAAQYYISPSGNNGNNCSEGAPCQTIQQGVSLLSAGDTLYLRGGNYSGGGNNIGYPTNTPFPSGTSWSNAVTIAAYPGETVTVVNGGMTFNAGGDLGHGAGGEKYIIIDRINFFGVNAGFFADDDTDHIRIQNLVLDSNGYYPGAHYNIVSGGGQFIEVLNVEIKNSSGYGIYWFGQDSLFDNLNVHHNCAYGVHMYHDPQPSGPRDDVDRNTLRNSWIHDNDTGGDAGCPYADTDQGGSIIGAGFNNKAYNNVFSNNYFGLQLNGRCNQCEIYNNVMYGNRAYGLYASNYNNEVTNMVVRNNVQYNNPAGDFFNEGAPGLTMTHNWTGSQGNPQ